MRILIAEDDPSIAEGLQRTLRKAGHAVDWAKTGGEADAALGSEAFDLLILDISLPRLSGFEVLKRLRARDSRVPVLSGPKPRPDGYLQVFVTDPDGHVIELCSPPKGG